MLFYHMKIHSLKPKEIILADFAMIPFTIMKSFFVTFKACIMCKFQIANLAYKTIIFSFMNIFASFVNFFGRWWTGFD